MVVDHPEAELTALCDIRPRTELALEPFDVPFYHDLEDMLAEEFDVLCVCTPNGYHASQALKGLEARRHVVCEKPMGLTRAECENVIYKALNKSRHVFCVMQNRYSPPSVWLKDVIEEGVLGDIYMVQLNCYWNRDDRYYRPDGRPHPWKGKRALDGGPLYTQFSHFIDIMYWLFGDITDIQARFDNFNHHDNTEFEDSGLVSFKFVNGGIGCLNYSTSVWGSNLESSLQVIGSRGSLKVGGQYMNAVETCNIENYQMPVLPEGQPANQYQGYTGSAANHVFVIENVIDVIRGRKTITTNALEGLKVVDIIERIYAVRPDFVRV